MLQRGRKSALALAPVTVLPGQRPQPPASLTPAQAERWQRIVASKPADWFQAESFPLLEAYLVAADLAATLKAEIDRFAKRRGRLAGKRLADFRALAREHREASDTLMRLATKMRLTQQSRYTEKKAGTAARNGAKALPWQTAG